MKRGYDTYTSGYRGNHPHGQYPPGFKKYRREDVDPVNPTPSRVLHVRNLTPETTEADLLTALSHFGNVAYTTLMANGHMALAEFVTMDEARACIAYSKNHQIMVRNHPVLINYSTSEKIQRGGLEGEDPNKVIVLTISNVTYPITVETLKEICSEHGNVNRIALIKRPGVLQALVEFDNAEEATKAKYGLNGADIYDNACTLKVEFGKMDTVKVTANNADQWDYTCDPATKPENQAEGNGKEEGESSWRPPPRRHEPDPSFMQPNSYASGGGYFPSGDGPRGRGGYRGRGVSRGGTYIPDERRQGFFDERSSGYEVGYGPPRGGTYRGRGAPRGGSWVEGRNEEYGYHRGGYTDRGRGGSSYRGGFNERPERFDRDYDRDRHHDYYEDRYSHDDRYHSDKYAEDKREYRESNQPERDHGPGFNGAVVMIYGVDGEKFNCDRLFNLLCCYGNCLKIKIMRSKPDTCMVQMGSPQEAASVIEHCHELQMFGKTLTFRPSKQDIVHNVLEPHSLQDGTPAFKDYTSSTVHRFSTPEMAALNKIVFPNERLYWKNAPPIMNSEVMKKLFSQKNAPIPLDVKVLESSTSCSGILTFGNVRDASEALMLCNNMVISGAGQTNPFVFKLSYASLDLPR